MANNRLEELRRRAQERIQQVRESMERGEDVAQSAPPMEAPPPPPAERRRESTTRDAYQVGPQSLEGPSLEGRSLEVPGYETQRTQLEATLMETLRPTSFSEGPQRRPVAPIATQRGRRSRAAKVLNKNSLRQAMLAIEILGQPVSERPPQGLGEL